MLLCSIRHSIFIGSVATAWIELWLLGGSKQNPRSDFTPCHSGPGSLMSSVI